MNPEFELEPMLPEVEVLTGAALIRLKGIQFRIESWETQGQTQEADGSDLIVIYMLGRAQQGHELREMKLTRHYNLIRASDRAVLEQLFVALGIDMKLPITVRLNQLVGKYVEVHSIQA